RRHPARPPRRRPALHRLRARPPCAPAPWEYVRALHALPCPSLGTRTMTAALTVLASLLRVAGPRSDRIELWTGSNLPPDERRQARFSLRVKSPALFARLLLRPNLATLGEAYVAGELELNGDLLAACEVADRLVNGDPTPLRSLLHAWSVRPSL